MSNQRLRRLLTLYMKFFLMLTVFVVALAPLRLGWTIVPATSNHVPPWLNVAILVTVTVVGIVLAYKLCKLGWRSLKDFGL
jgi:hypothetical protein